MRASVKGVLAMAAAVLTVAAGAAGCSSSDGGGKGSGSGAGRANGPVVEQDGTAHPAQLVKLNNAQHVKVPGVADAAAAKRIDDAFHAPIDWAVKWAGATLLKEQRAECGNRSNVISVGVRIGLRGDIVSAASAIRMVPCYEGEGGLPTVPVTADVKAGKVLAPDDVLTAEALRGSGLKTLFDRLSGPKDDWKDCELELRRADLYPGKRDGDPIESPAPAGLLFTQQGLELIWSTTGTDCNNFTFTAPYDKVKDLVKPDLYPRLVAAAGAK